MDGLWSLTSKEEEEDPTQFVDLDSFFDFDPIKEWLLDPNPNPMPDSDLAKDSDVLESRNIELGHQDPILEPSIHEKMEKVSLVEKKEVDNSVSLDSVGEQRNGSIGFVEEVKSDGVGEVCSVSDPIKVATESDVEEETEDSSSSDSSSSSSSSEEEEESSSSEEEEDDDEDKAIEIEEGEIMVYDREGLVLGSDGEDVPKGPIKSKHEVEVLPPVRQVEETLEPHHQTLPVGVVSSILGNSVIVDGSEKHNPLREGSILWITETRLPLGIVDEIFGPVKNPYYIVMYNSDEDVPPGISVGAAVSFVVEFANHILNEKGLYQKGYDASGDHDEEVSDEVEFSDDEKEAEYKRSLRQQKRGTNHVNQEYGFGKKKTNFKGSGIHKDKQPSLSQSSLAAAMGQPLPSQPSQLHASLPSANFGCKNRDCPHGAASPGINIAPSPTMVPPYPSQSQAFQMGVSGVFGDPSQQFNTVLTHGFPSQPIGIQGGGFSAQLQSMGIQAAGFPPQPQPMGMGIQGGFPHQPRPMGIQGGFLMTSSAGQQFGDQTYSLQHQNQVFNCFARGMMPNQQQQQQQLVSNIGAPPGNLPWFGGPANPSIFPAAALFGSMAQGGFGQFPFGCGNVNPQGSLDLSNEQRNGQGTMRLPSVQFNQGSSSSRGRKPYQRGGRHSIGGCQRNG